MSIDGLEELSRSAEIRTPEARAILFAYDVAITGKLCKNVYDPLVKQHPEVEKYNPDLRAVRDTLKTMDDLKAKSLQKAQIKSAYNTFAVGLEELLAETLTEEDLKQIAALGLDLNELKKARDVFAHTDAIFEQVNRFYNIEEQVLYNRLTAIKAIAKERRISSTEAAYDTYEVIRRTFSSKDEVLTYLRLVNNVSRQIEELLFAGQYIAKIMESFLSTQAKNQVVAARNKFGAVILASNAAQKFLEQEYAKAFSSRPKRGK